MKEQAFIETIKKTDNNVVIMVGVPLSGKSTFIEKIKDYCNILSRDNLVTEEAAKLGLTYTEGFDIVNNSKNIDSVLNNNITKAGKTTENFVIDMTNVGKKRRKGFLKKFPNHTKFAVVLDIPSYDVIRERNESRDMKEGKFIPMRVIENMISRFVFPTKEEGFDHIVSIK